MSYTYLLERGVESSAECFSDIPAFVLSRLNLTPEKSFSSDSATESSPNSQSGMMCVRSTAGFGEGLDGARSGLWTEMCRIICEVGPRIVFVENSPALTSRGLGRVLADLASLGFDARWGVLGARACGGPVERERIWIAGTHEGDGSAGLGAWGKTKVFGRARTQCPNFWVQAPPVSFGVEHGLDSYMDQVSAIGNGQVPQVARLAWELMVDEAGLTANKKG